MSNLFRIENKVSIECNEIRQEGLGSYGCPTINLVSPEAVPAAKPLARSVEVVLSFFGNITGIAEVEASAVFRFCDAIRFPSSFAIALENVQNTVL